MKALVTGGAGFIGSHVADALCAGGWEVVILDNLATGSTANLPVAAEFFEGDAGDTDLLARIMPGCRAVFHLAAVSSVQDSLDRPLAVHETNLTATLALLESAVRHRVPRFVFSSSAAVYGDTGGRPAREEMTPTPLSHYAVQKLACEHYCGVYRRLHGLETVCLRYFNVYGPRQRADSPYSGVIAKFIDAATNRRAMTIFGDGSQSRDFCHVSDVVAANLSAVTASPDAIAHGIFNIGSGTSVTIGKLGGILAELSASASAPEHREARPGEIKFSQADITRASAQLGYRPSIELAQGLGGLL